MEGERAIFEYRGFNEIYYESGGGIDELYEKGYVEKLPSGEYVMPSVAAVHLLEQGKVVIREEGREVTALEVLEDAVKASPDNILRYFVFKDLRTKGRLAKVELNTPFIRLYPRGGRVGETPATTLIYCISEDKPIRQSEILEKIKYAQLARKSLIFAVIDDEMNISYYAAEEFEPKKIREVDLSFPEADGIVMHDRVIVWDHEVGNAIYKAGFWGHFIGVAKPRHDQYYEKPLQLSLTEACYLAEKKKIKLYRVGTHSLVSTKEIAELHAKSRVKGAEKIVAYTYWRDRGYVVKPASKYGVDFMFYELGPGIDHGPYMCLVSTPDEMILPVELIRAGRIATSVRKTFVVTVVDGSRVVNYKFSWRKL